MKKNKIRLNKYISNSGYCARRKADELIVTEQVKINNILVKELTTWVSPNDTVVVQGKEIVSKNIPITLLLNKPTGVITTTYDPQGRKTITQHLESQLQQQIEKIHRHRKFNKSSSIPDATMLSVFERSQQQIRQFIPIGRLDKETSGAIVLTQNRELSHEWSHPSKNIIKTYFITCTPLDTSKQSNVKRTKSEKPEGEILLLKAQKGAILEDGFFRPDKVEWLKDKATRKHQDSQNYHYDQSNIPIFKFKVTMHGGKNRILRRYFKALGMPIFRLHRETFHHYHCNDLEIGELKIIQVDYD